jgi:hypothetical protein
MTPIQHPTEKETIDGIIKLMVPDHTYKFGELWSPVYKATLHQIMWESPMGRCFDKMIKENLIKEPPNWPFMSLGTGAQKAMDDLLAMNRVYIHGEYPTAKRWDTLVKLTDLGIEVREAGGWIEYRNKIPWYLHFGKKAMLWTAAAMGTVLLGVITMIAYDWRPNWTKPALPATDQTTPQKETISEPLEQPAGLTKPDSIPQDTAKTK